MTTPKASSGLEAAATDYAIDVAKPRACPACGEETIWHLDLEAFKSGAEWQEERILGILRSDELIFKFHYQKNHTDAVNWLKEQLNKGE